jgi:CRP/FNR family transcriptional regulator
MTRITGTYAAPKQTWYISSINLFDGICDTDLQAWIARCGARTFQPGERIVDAETTPPEQVFVVNEGAVRLVRTGNPRPETIDVLGPGQLFGVSAAFGDGAIALHVEALTRVQVCAAEGKGFLIALASCPDIVLNLVRQVGIRIMHFGGCPQPEQSPAQIRLAEVLQRLALTAGQAHQGRLRIPACVSRGTLAHQVGCTRETVARLLSNLEVSGAVVRKGRTILIDPQELADIIKSGSCVPVVQQAIDERA